MLFCTCNGQLGFTNREASIYVVAPLLLRSLAASNSSLIHSSSNGFALVADILYLTRGSTVSMERSSQLELATRSPRESLHDHVIVLTLKRQSRMRPPI